MINARLGAGGDSSIHNFGIQPAMALAVPLNSSTSVMCAHARSANYRTVR